MRQVKVNTLKSLSLKESVAAGEKLLLIEAIGIADSSMLGKPILYRVNSNVDNKLLEFDFMLEGEFSDKRSNIECEIRIVYRLKKSDIDAKAIKVNAKFNSDIIMIISN